MLYNYWVAISDSPNGTPSVVLPSLRQVHETIQVQTGSLRHKYMCRRISLPTSSNAQTCAIKVKADLSQPHKRPPKSKTKNEKAFPLKNNEMTMNQQLQLILEKLDMQKTNRSIISRTDGLENATFEGANLKRINVQLPMSRDLDCQRAPTAQRKPNRHTSRSEHRCTHYLWDTLYHKIIH
jgi:hypothetical protein